MADWGYPEIDDVVILNSSNHQQFLNDFDEALVYYHLPKCKHCVEMDKFFGAMALDYKERDQRIPFASFDCSQDIQFCNQNNIPAYPFVKFFVRGHPIIYYEKRERQFLEKFLNKILDTQPKQIELKDIENIETNSIYLLYFGQKSSQGFHLYDLASKLHQELKFFWIQNNFEISDIQQVKIFKDHLFHKTDFQNDMFVIKGDDIQHLDNLNDFESIDQFINKIKHPDIIQLDDSFYDMLRKGPQNYFILFVEKFDDKKIIEFQKFANDHKKKIKFLLASKDQKDQKVLKHLQEVLLIQDQDIPSARIFQTSYSLNTVRKYKMEGKLNYSLYQKLFREFKSDSIKPYYKFQEITRQNYGNLQILNSYDYQHRVFKSGQDSVVLYHSEFEQHQDSKKMLKIIQKISQNENFKDIKYFSIDADKNEIQSFYHDQRPVLLLYSKKDLRNPLIYDKDCDFKKVKNFIKSKRNIQRKRDLEEHFNTEL